MTDSLSLISLKNILKMNPKILVRFEPFFNEWITMEKNGSVFSVEFEDGFSDENHPEIKRITPNYSIENACSVPIVVQILLTKNCTYRCPHCPVAEESASKYELSTKEVKNIIDYCANSGVLFIRFSGGESTMRSDFPELVEYALSLGLHCGLLSNCRTYSEEVMNVLPKLSYMQTHLDSVDEDCFNKLTGGNNFNTFCETLSQIRRNGVKVNAAMTLMKENQDEIKDIIDFCTEFGLTLKINTIYSDADGKFQKREWESYYKDVIVPFRKIWPTLKQYAKSIGCEAYSFIDIEPLDDSVRDPIAVTSPWGRSYIVIDSIGDMYPFSLIMKPEFKLGSIRNGDNILDVWKNSKFLEFLRSISKTTLGCEGCRMDCVYSNLFFSYSYFGEFGHILPNLDCPYGKHKLI